MPNIKLNNVSLDYPIYDPVHRSLTRVLTSRIPVGGKIREGQKKKLSILALDDVSFELKRGDRVALLGHNGAGKTSLLKVLSGFFAPSSGTAVIDGRIAALLDLASGLDMQLTGHENIMLCGMLRGLSRKQVKEKIPEIEAFCELGPYLSLPVKTYSQGMVIRLAFSICTSVACDVLLLDEWFGAGDQAFVTKSRERLKQVIQDSAILVFATHSIDIAKQLCNKGMYFEQGSLIMFDQLERVIEFQQDRAQRA